MLPLPLALFAATLLFYHTSEVLLVALIEPEELDLSSLLLSPPYLLAMALGLLEHLLTARFLPALKAALLARLLPPGLLLTLLGSALRLSAWLTARAAFTHRIQSIKRPHHRLVTHGVYAWTRHPGYLGWLLWAVGTQLLLANPLCAPAFLLVAHRFFARRIPAEEAHLARLFGPPYLAYRRAVPSRIPGIA